jgi:phosphoribosylaminoimidazole-succinocarboxamide synthase
MCPRAAEVFAPDDGRFWYGKKYVYDSIHPELVRDYEAESLLNHACPYFVSIV